MSHWYKQNLEWLQKNEKSLFIDVLQKNRELRNSMALQLIN